MNVDPTGHFAITASVASLIICAVVGATVAAATSVVIQLSTTGELSLAQMGISALFGAVTGVLSFTGIGGVIGQFFIQGALAVGELYSIAALDGDVSSIYVEEIVATFLFSGALGAIGSKGAAAEFKRIGQIGSDFIKYFLRDIKRHNAPVLTTFLTRGAKYFKELLIPLAKSSLVIGGITAITNISDY